MRKRDFPCAQNDIFLRNGVLKELVGLVPETIQEPQEPEKSVSPFNKSIFPVIFTPCLSYCQ